MIFLLAAVLMVDKPHYEYFVKVDEIVISCEHIISYRGDDKWGKPIYNHSQYHSISIWNVVRFGPTEIHYLRYTSGIYDHGPDGMLELMPCSEGWCMRTKLYVAKGHLTAWRTVNVIAKRLIVTTATNADYDDIRSARNFTVKSPIILKENE